MRPEILAPVGSMEALNAALAAGCDAVYFEEAPMGRGWADIYTYKA